MNQYTNKVVSVFLLLVTINFISTSVLAETQVLKFKLSASNLPNRDIDGTSDPYVKLFVAEGKGRDYDRFGETKGLDNIASPNWDDVFVFGYDSTKNQRWRFLVKDWDFAFFADDHLGRMDMKVSDYVAEIMKNGNKPVQVFLTDPKGGVLTITPMQ